MNQTVQIVMVTLTATLLLLCLVLSGALLVLRMLRSQKPRRKPPSPPKADELAADALAEGKTTLARLAEQVGDHEADITALSRTIRSLAESVGGELRGRRLREARDSKRAGGGIGDSGERNNLDRVRDDPAAQEPESELEPVGRVGDGGPGDAAVATGGYEIAPGNGQPLAAPEPEQGEMFEEPPGNRSRREEVRRKAAKLRSR